MKITFLRRAALAVLPGAAVLLMGACTGLDPNVLNPATMQAELTAIADEETRIAEAGTALRTQVAATAVAAETYVVRADGVNTELVRTMRAVMPPTRQLVDTSGGATPGLNAPLSPADAAFLTPNAPGTMADTAAMAGAPAPIPGDPSARNQLTEVGVSLDVRESDGCAADSTTQFSAAVPRIYATARALNIVGGTSLYVAWSYEGASVSQSSVYTVPSDDDDFCIWFYLEPTDAALSAGAWSVQFFIDGAPGPTANFAVSA